MTGIEPVTSASQRQRSTAELHPDIGRGCPPTIIYGVADGILRLIQRSLLHPLLVTPRFVHHLASQS